MFLSIEKLSKIFYHEKESHTTLDTLDLDIRKGEFLCVLGPSGCGKSTLLNIIAGLEKATGGRVVLNGKEITGPGSDRVVMFQESALFPWLRVIDNVEFGMKIAKVPKEERRERALKFLKMTHLTRFQNSMVHELSGGMKQRVALARALTMNSDILLMDEPFAALDSQTKHLLLLELQQIWQETGKTIIFITHNVEEAVILATRVIVMSAHPGRIKKQLDIQLARPRSLESQDLGHFTKVLLETLKEEVEKVAKSEYDTDWSLEKDTLLSGPDSTLGADL